MKINKVLDYYYRAYDRAEKGAEQGRSIVNAGKHVLGAGSRPVLYMRIKKALLRVSCGPWYWPSTFPTAADQPTVEFLYSLVRLVRPEIAVEIGTAKGNSAIAIGQALHDNGCGTLHTIDPEEQELTRIAVRKSGLSERIRYHIGYSTEVIPRLGLSHIDFAFIDGDHGEEHVRADWELVWPLLVSGSVVAFHDTILFDGPRSVVDSIIRGGGYSFLTLPTINKAGISAVRKL